MNVLFRVDASTSIGAGHVLRCLALANAVRKHGGFARFACAALPKALHVIVESAGHDVVTLPSASDQLIDARHTCAAGDGTAWNWIVVDHYGLDHRWERAVREVAARVMVIDDLANREHQCDVLLDQNLGFNPATRYSGIVPPGCATLLGPQFALLREEFATLHSGSTPRSGAARRVLVAFGGMDENDYTTMTLTALARVRDRFEHVAFIVGEANPQRIRIVSECASNGFTCHVQPPDIASLMQRSDIAIGAGGIMIWERCAVGLPAFIFSVAANQDEQVRAAAAENLVYAPDPGGAGVSADFIERHFIALAENPRLRESISRRCLAVVDGRGVDRVLPRIDVDSIQIHEAAATDIHDVFEWRNAHEVRASSPDSRAIPWETHQRWFQSMIVDKGRLMVIGKRDGNAVGVVRFDISENAAEVSIYLTPGSHPTGTGSILLRSAENWLSASRKDVTQLKATVLAHNARSRRLFEGAGYEESLMVFTKTFGTGSDRA